MTTSTANLILLATGVAAFLAMGMGQSLYGPALPAFSRDLDVSEPAASLLVSAHWVGCGIGVLGMFLAGARIGLVLAFGMMAAGALGVSMMAGLPLTLLAAVIFGTGYGAATVLINPRILRAFGPRQGPAMVSLVNAVFGAGAIIGPGVFVWMGGDPGPAFLLVAVTILIVAAATLFTPGEAAPPLRAAGRFNPRLPLMVFPAIGIGCEALLVGLGPSALIAAGQTELAAAGYLSAFFAVFLLARVILIFTAHLAPPFAVYIGAMAGVAVMAGVTALTGSPWAFVAMGAFAALLFPGFYVAATQLMGDDPRVSPTIIAAGLVGGIFLPLVVGPILPVIGAVGFFGLILGLALITLALSASFGARALIARPAMS